MVIAIGTIGLAKASGAKSFSNADPRDPGFYQTPFRKRALGAHNNGNETFAFFAAAIVVAELHHARQGVVDGLAVAFLLARLAYVAAYLGDRPTVRSAVFTLGFAINVAILVSPAFAPG